MTAPVTDIVTVSVTTSSAAVQSAGFGTGLVASIHKHNNDRVRTYNNTAGMAADGFLSSEEAFKAAAAYFAQSPAPTAIKIGRRSVDVVNITITAVNTFTYSVTINGVAYTFVSDGSALTTEVRDGLIAAIGTNVAGLTPSSGGAAVLTLTGTTDLAWSLGALSANLVASAFVASALVGTDLDAIVLADPDFYGVVGTDRSSSNLQAIVTWATANKRLAFVSTQEAGVVDVVTGSDTTTLAAILKAAGSDRAFCLYHASANANYIDAAAMGRVLAFKPGAYTLDLKDLQGITVSSLTPTERVNAWAKYCNTYESRGGLNQLTQGWVASGKFVDQVHGRDWLSNEVAVDIFAALSASLKVPFTDAGIAIIEAAVRQAGALGVTRGYLESFTTSFPTRADVSANDRALRVLSNAKMVAQEAGAIHKVTFEINVQV